MAKDKIEKAKFYPPQEPDFAIEAPHGEWLTAGMSKALRESRETVIDDDLKKRNVKSALTEKGGKPKVDAASVLRAKLKG